MRNEKGRSRMGLIRIVATAVCGLGLAASGLQAAPTTPATLLGYKATGTIGSTGVTGSNVISYNSVASGAFTTPSSFSLGEFVVAPLADGQTTTYNDTPFIINYQTDKVNGSEPMGLVQPIILTGRLNGTVSGPSQSDLVATFDNLPSPTISFLLDPSTKMTNTLDIIGGTQALVPSTTNGGRTTVQGRITSSIQPVPEPATIAIFATAIVGVALRRRLRSANA